MVGDNEDSPDLVQRLLTYGAEAAVDGVHTVGLAFDTKTPQERIVFSCSGKRTGHTLRVRILVSMLAAIVAYAAATMVFAAVVGESSGGLRLAGALGVAAVAAATVYTAVKDGPRALLGLFHRR